MLGAHKYSKAQSWEKSTHVKRNWSWTFWGEDPITMPGKKLSDRSIFSDPNSRFPDDILKVLWQLTQSPNMEVCFLLRKETCKGSTGSPHGKSVHSSQKTSAASHSIQLSLYFQVQVFWSNFPFLDAHYHTKDTNFISSGTTFCAFLTLTLEMLHSKTRGIHW